MRREMHPIEPEELMAYLDGELMPQRASEAAQHLLHCRECQSAAAEMQSVARRLMEWQIEEAGPRIELAINAARPPERSRPIWRRGVPWIAGLAAACILLLIWSPRRYVRLGSPAKLSSTEGYFEMGYPAVGQQGQQGQQGRRRLESEPLPQAVPRVSGSGHNKEAKDARSGSDQRFR